MDERSYVDAGGHRLEFATFDPPERCAGRAPIVLLHEGLGSVALWKRFPHALAARTGRTVVAYSRYGYGFSDVLQGDRDAEYLHDEGERVLPAVLTALGLERPVLFGHSDGASIALLCAAAHPALASALILEAPHVFVEELSIAGLGAAREAFAAGGLREKLAPYHRDAVRTFYGWNRIWLDPRFRDWNIEASADAVRAPLLVIQGDDDEYGTAAQYRAIAARAPHARVLALRECGHTPHREREAETLDAVASFLAPLS